MLLVGKGFLTLKDIWPLENKSHQEPLLCKKQAIAREHVDVALYKFDGVIEKLLLFVLVCDLDRQQRALSLLPIYMTKEGMKNIRDLNLAPYHILLCGT